MSLNTTAAAPSLQDQALAVGARCLAWAQRQSILTLAIIAGVFMACLDLAGDPSRLTTAFGDTDDAARLTEVRQLLAGQGWYDMSMPRFGGHDPLVSHWSRLIDLPLALLMMAANAMFGQETGELVVRMAWPTLLSIAIIAIIAVYCNSSTHQATPTNAKTAHRVSPTALLAIVLAGPAMGHCQFAAGRIDHHNGMIIGAVSGIFLLLASLDRPKLGWFAGLAFGLGCAIGYEGLGLTALALAIVVLTCIWRGDDLAGLARAAVAFATTLTVAFLVFGPVNAGGAVVCDALSTNLLALAGCGAAGVMLAHGARRLGQSRLTSFAYAAICGGVGLGLYVITQPVCMGGPMAQLEPALVPIWFNLVQEVRSIPQVMRDEGMAVLLFVLYLPLAVAYAAPVLKGRLMRHGELYVALFAVAAVMGLWQIRLLPYASFLAVPLIAFGVQRPASPIPAKPFDLASLTPVQLTGLAGAAFGVLALAFISMPKAPKPVNGVAAALAAQNVVKVPLTAKEQAAKEAACTSRDSLTPLRALDKGLAANDIDMGSYIVAHSNLDVMAAPYHRMGKSILANHNLMFASAPEAKARMQAMGARYVIVCDGAGTTKPAGQMPSDALRPALLEGRAPDFLEPVAMGSSPVKVWRLKD